MQQITNMGQAVQCNVSFGLLCKNRDQAPPLQRCFDYEIRLLCCDDYSRCTTSTPPVTTSTSTRETTTSETTASTVITTSSPYTSTSIKTTTLSITTTAPRTTTISSGSTTTKKLTSPKISLSTISTPTATTTYVRSTIPTSSVTTTTPSRTTSSETTTPQTTSSTTSGTTTPRTMSSIHPITPCAPMCYLTPWYDVDSPSPGVAGGDNETYQNILAAGNSLCKHPQSIECRAKDYPDLSMQQITNMGQVVQCNVSFGLLCKNSDQAPPLQRCFDYEIRLLCCDDYSRCTTTTPPVTTSTSTRETTTSETTASTVVTTSSPYTSTSIKTTTLSITTMAPRTTTISSGSTTTTKLTSPKISLSTISTPTTATTTYVRSTSPTSSVTTTTPSRTTSSETTTPQTTSSTTSGTTTPRTVSSIHPITSCAPMCYLTPWYDVDSPSPGVGGGDNETYQNILAAGNSLCKHPQSIECRAKDYPDLSMQQITNMGQVVQCNVSFGLLCKNSDQAPPLQRCFDYEIRLLCCDDYSRCTTTTPPVTTSTSTREATTSETTASTVVTTSSPYTSTSLKTTTLSITTTAPRTTTSSSGSTTTTKLTSPKISLSTISTPTATTTYVRSTTPTSSVTTTTPSRTTSSETTTPQTTSSTTSGTTTPRTMSSIHPITPCAPMCYLTPWYDVDSPSPGLAGGDNETYQNILAAGNSLCKHPQSIECRAKDYPDLSMQQITNMGQVVQCNVSFGLLCKNSDQAPPLQRCFDYEIRLLCCDDYSRCTTTTPPVTTSTSTRETTTSETTASTVITTSSPYTSTSIKTTTLSITTTAPRTTTISSGSTTTKKLTSPKISLSTISTPTATTTYVRSTIPTSSVTTITPSRTTSSETTTPQTTSSTTSGTTTPRTMSSIHPITPCAPMCYLTSWYDVDSPSPGVAAGDNETYQNILAAGNSLCKHPQSIECRAKDYPDLSMQQITNMGQVVQCNVSFGLLCKNSDQAPPLQRCFDYEIRLLCCDDYSRCTTTTPPETTSTSTKGTTASETTASTVVTTSSPYTSTSLKTTTLSITTTAPRTTTSSSGSTTTTKLTSPKISLSTISNPTATTTYVRSTTPTSSETTTTPSRTTSSETTTPQTTSSTTSGTTTPRTMSSIHPITPCAPMCYFTSWYDVDSPSPGVAAGDNETYQNILAAGNSLCKHPQSIECRAKDYPDLSMQQITNMGQAVQCNVSFGLLCKNRDQAPPLQRCFDYEIRLLCCDDYSRCTTTTPPVTTSTSTRETTTSETTASTVITTSSPYTSTSIKTTTLSITTTAPRTTTISSGSTTTKKLTSPKISLSTISTPTATTTYVRSTTPTSSVTTTTPSRTTTSETTTPQTTTSGTTTPRTMSSIHPITPCAPLCYLTPWYDVDSSSPGVAGGDNETYQNILAAGNSVCKHPESIECRAKDYPDLSMQQIRNMGQVVQCNVSFGLLCKNRDQAPPVERCFDYEIRVLCCDDYSLCTTTSPTVTTSTSTRETATSETTASTVITISSPYTRTSIKTTTFLITTFTPRTAAGSSGTSASSPLTTKTSTSSKETATSVAAETTITTVFTASRIETTTPSRTITSGVSPTGHVTSSSRFLSSTSKEYSSVSSLTRIRSSFSTLANVTSSKSFHFTSFPVSSRGIPCFCVINDIHFASGDVIYNISDSAGCFFYAICNQTCQVERFQGPCPTTTVTSPAPSSSLSQSTPESTLSTRRSSRQGIIETTPVSPNETTIYNHCLNATCSVNGSIIVEKVKCPVVKKVMCESGLSPKKVYDEYGCCYVYKCDYCIGPEGEHRLPGETWTSNCKACECEMHSTLVKCQPISCEYPSPEPCDKEGYEYVQILNPDNPCCIQTRCQCNPRLCNNTMIACKPGYRLTPLLPGDCCMAFECKPKNVCVVNGAEYQPDTTIPLREGSCEECNCTSDKNPVTGLNLLMCETISCYTQCPEGYEYRRKPGECCGECVQAICIMKTANSSLQVIRPGDTWYPPGTNCSYYRCDKIDDQFLLVMVNITCPDIQPEDCESGTIQNTADGCCKKCKAPKPCGIRQVTKAIKLGPCMNDVNFTYCDGICQSSSTYMRSLKKMAHKCTCCQELKTSTREVQLFCSNGIIIPFQYAYVEKCGCLNSVCVPLESASSSREEKGTEGKKYSRWRTRAQP
ncbi:mucin-5B-like [Rhinatrema bivittatum]|uniref:mucin-5B-like n=1 Tax=Rhinatrema bivittatum TaxID=194408 RepID=UPI00112C6842|nr:mucin-5B-like [Rhinatrema bivittatum]